MGATSKFVLHKGILRMYMVSCTEIHCYEVYYNGFEGLKYQIEYSIYMWAIAISIFYKLTKLLLGWISSYYAKIHLIWADTTHLVDIIFWRIRAWAIKQGDRGMCINKISVWFYGGHLASWKLQNTEYWFQSQLRFTHLH